MREVRRYPDPVLLKISEPITRFDQRLRHFVEEMFEAMYTAKGVGLAAAQVGVNVRLFVINCEFHELGAEAETVLINPEIIETHDPEIAEEGCLSFPAIYADVERARRVKVKYQDLDGNWHEEEAEGLRARAIQHELDHLEGKVFIDYLSPEQLQDIRKDLAALKRDFKKAQKTKAQDS